MNFELVKINCYPPCWTIFATKKKLKLKISKITSNGVKRDNLLQINS